MSGIMHISDGISQNDRSNFFQKENYFLIDELDFNQLICYVKDFAKNIKYFNNKNEHDGYWDELLISDEIIIFSEIIVLNIQKTETDFLNNFDNYVEIPLVYLTKQINLIYRLAKYWNSWYKRLYILDFKRNVEVLNEIDSLIRNQLSAGFRFCVNLAEQFSLKDSRFYNVTDNHDFDKIWWFSEKYQELKSPSGINKTLKKVFYDFNNSVYYLKKTVKEYMNSVLLNQQHSSYIGLLFTFLKLYQSSQDKLNAFSNNYYSFYYNKVLKIKPQKYNPDSTFLLFELKDGFEELYLKKGTRFSAGKDENKEEVIYTADKDIILNKASIGKLLTLYFDNNQLISPGCGATNIYKDEIKIIPPGNFDPGKLEKKPLFGVSHKNAGRFADIGFSISDVNLLLGEGNRKVSFDFTFTEESFSAFMYKLNALKDKYSLKEAFVKLFPNIFNIYLTITDGWLNIENYIINASFLDEHITKNTLRIQFELTPDMPPVIPLDDAVHGLNFKQGVPAVKFILNNNSYLFAYSLLNELELSGITIITEVTGLKNITISNDLGLLDTTKPFQPFGSIPVLNSYFIFGNSEMSQKDLTNLDLKIKWNNLPDDENGFADYFKQYNKQISLNDYKCNLSFLNNGEWLPEDKSQQQQISLFESDKQWNKTGGQKLSAVSVFENIETGYFHSCQPGKAGNEFRYSNYSTGGFIKVTLCNPQFCFGHKDYSEQLARISMENARKKQHKPLPNPPFSPVAESVIVNYTSKSVLNFSLHKKSSLKKHQTFCHIHPWGVNNLFYDIQHKEINLLPEYKSEGYLFVGFTNVKPNTTVSVFFNLFDDSRPETEEEPPVINWQYLTSDIWKDLPEENLISDSTNSFLKSGIITIRMPEDINRNNSILSEKYFWIGISINKKTDTVCSVANIFTQAVRVTWEYNENSHSHLKRSLPSLSIVKAETDLKGIKLIVQPVNSFNGRPDEEFQQTKIRIGERLIHKNRAVIPRDYESLILENFADIYKVKCFPNMNSKEQVAPGNVLITVIKMIDPRNRKTDFEPMVNNITLREIKSFISAYAPAAATIEVRNPVYERVQVRCAVKIKTGLDAGYFINLLNDELISYLTPWQSAGNNEPGFGKDIKCTDVLSFIQGLEYIDFVTDFSMVQITRNNQAKYALLDTAPRTYREIKNNDHADFSEKSAKILKPEYPWGILISDKKHDIEIINRINQVEPVKIGINELVVGRNFIIE